jgi:heptose I phosphotransferase
MLLVASCLLLLGGLLLARLARRARRRFVSLHPAARALLRRRRWSEPEAFLDLPARVVSGHPGRDVARVELGEGTAYLKRQQRVSWKERFASARAGWGLVSRCLREARVLDALQREGIPAPRWLAVGEDGAGRAFVLVEGAPGVTLAAWLGGTDDPAARRRMAERLGADLARVHAAGFVHGDLYAKHVLVGPGGRTFCLLDWQRGRRAGRWATARRLRDLAALHATLPAHLAGARLRLACLRAYRRGLAVAGWPADVPARRVATEANRLLERRHVREKRDLAPGLGQAWLPGGGEVAITHLGPGLLPGVQPWLTPPRAAQARHWLELPGRGRALLEWRRAQPAWRPHVLRPALSWEQQRAAYLLRLERLGLDAPRALAAGRAGGALFLLSAPPEAIHLDAWLRRGLPGRADALARAGAFLRRLHDGCFYLGSAALAVRPAAQPTPVLAGLDGLAVRRRASNRLARRDLAMLEAGLARAGCTEDERGAFRAGYCGQTGNEESGMGNNLSPPARRASPVSAPGVPTIRRDGPWRLLQAPDWEGFAGAGWPGRIMQVEVTDRFSAKQGRSTGRLVLDGEGGSRLVVYLKRHHRLPWWLGLLARAWTGCSPALREWEHLRWAQAQGVPVPRAVAAGERLGPGWRLESFLAVEELTGMLPVNEAIPFARASLSPEGFRRWKRGLAAEMARLARLLHDRRRYHKDLYLCHFYLHQDDTTAPAPPGGWEGRVSLIDLHRLGHHPWAWPIWLLKDLAQLLYSSAVPGVNLRDRLWFWRCYRGPGSSASAARWLRRGVLFKWRLYQRHAQRRQRRQASA